MRKLLSILLITFALNAYSQEVMTDWRKMDSQTSLNRYIYDKAYPYLNYEPTVKDSANASGVKISHRSDSTLIILRDSASVPNTPLVIINNYPIDNKEIWAEIKLKDIKKMTLHKPNERTFAVYGSRGYKGLILVKMNKLRCRELMYKYGG